MTKQAERETVRVDNMAGGEGFAYREHLLTGDALGKYVQVFAKITVPAGNSLGYHQHVGNEETYYILSGAGEYNDNGTIVPCEAGDVFKCEESGYHGIVNTGTEDLVFLALIVEV